MGSYYLQMVIAGEFRISQLSISPIMADLMNVQKQSINDGNLIQTRLANMNSNDIIGKFIF